MTAVAFFVVTFIIPLLCQKRSLFCVPITEPGLFLETYGEIYSMTPLPSDCAPWCTARGFPIAGYTHYVHYGVPQYRCVCAPNLYGQEYVPGTQNTVPNTTACQKTHPLSPRISNTRCENNFYFGCTSLTAIHSVIDPVGNTGTHAILWSESSESFALHIVQQVVSGIAIPSYPRLAMESLMGTLAVNNLRIALPPTNVNWYKNDEPEYSRNVNPVVSASFYDKRTVAIKHCISIGRLYTMIVTWPANVDSNTQNISYRCLSYDRAKQYYLLVGSPLPVCGGIDPVNGTTNCPPGSQTYFNGLYSPARYLFFQSTVNGEKVDILYDFYRFRLTQTACGVSCQYNAYRISTGVQVLAANTEVSFGTVSERFDSYTCTGMKVCAGELSKTVSVSMEETHSCSVMFSAMYKLGSEFVGAKWEVGLELTYGFGHTDTKSSSLTQTLSFSEDVPEVAGSNGTRFQAMTINFFKAETITTTTVKSKLNFFGSVYFQDAWGQGGVTYGIPLETFLVDDAASFLVFSTITEKRQSFVICNSARAQAGVC